AFALWGTVYQAWGSTNIPWAREQDRTRPWAWALDRLPEHGARTESQGFSSGINVAIVYVYLHQGPNDAAWMQRSGWPLRAFEYRHVGLSTAWAPGTWPDDSTGWRPPPWLARAKYYVNSQGPRPPVPLRPIPLGLAVDSAFYGGLLFAAFAVLGPGRRALRR